MKTRQRRLSKSSPTIAEALNKYIDEISSQKNLLLKKSQLIGSGCKLILPIDQ